MNGNGLTITHSIVNGNKEGDANVPVASLGSDIFTGDPGFYNNPLGRDGGGVVPDVTFANNVENATQPSGGFWDKVDYVGGVDPDDPWINAGWCTFSDN